MKSKIIFLLLIYMTLSSCVSTESVSIGTVKKDTSTIEVYFKDANSPKKDYEILAYVEVSGSIFTSKSSLLKALKKKTDKLGGDAVINVKYFYIPWGFGSLPALDGVVVKFK